MRPVILYANEKNEVIIKKDELNRLFQQIYEEGYEEGYEDGKKATIDYTPHYWNIPHFDPVPIVTCDSTLVSNESSQNSKFIHAYNDNTDKE